MRSIKPLPEAVRSSVRSGIILYDLTRVVEELVLNSLDAGATKVYVAVGVGTCFVKVVDNGCGVDRDGLTLLGERYATSRYDHFTDLEANGSFGFHGEALSSIADVSLLEIITKAQGMPHGYRKIMKGSNCLYLGIDDSRRDVGTTVVVRDLFYNQPVRRKHMQSRPKKILHLVKKCVLRVALVQPWVSFTVSDIESEDELLSTGSSPSPLQLLSSNFGIEASSSLNEVKACEAELKLSGYISCPFGIAFLKAFQYIYINSRFVCKGPMHKLVNQLAAGYSDNMKFDTGSQHQKRNRSQMCPVFVLNLSCPRSYYDMTFEPSKNSVEFRDWGPILIFIQNVINHIWMGSSSEDLYVNRENGRKRCRTQKWQASVEFPYSELEKSTEDCHNLPAWREDLLLYQEPIGDAPEIERLQAEALVIHDDLCKKQVEGISGSKWQFESFETDNNMGNMSTARALSIDCHEFSDDADVNWDLKNFSHQISLSGSLSHDGPTCKSEVGFEFESDDFEIQQKWVHHPEGDVEEEDDVDQIFEESSFRQDEAEKVWSFSKCTKLYGRGKNSKSLSPEMKSYRECLAEEKCILPNSLKFMKKCSSNQNSYSTEWAPLSSNALYDTKFSDIDQHFEEDVHDSHSKYDKDTRYTYFPDIEEDQNFSHDLVDNWGEENCSVSGCRYSSFDCKFNDSFWVDNKKYSGDKHKGSLFATCSKVSADEMGRGHFYTSDKISLPDSSDSLYHTSLSRSDRNRCGRIQIRNQQTAFHHRKRRRSYSAPPFYKHRKKFVSLANSLKMTAAKTYSPPTDNNSPIPETSNMGYPEELMNQLQFSLMQSYEDCLLSAASFGLEKSTKSLEMKNRELQTLGQRSILDPVKELTPKESEYILDAGQKWRTYSVQTMGSTLSGVKCHSVEDQDSILDISSANFRFPGDLLVPNSIGKNSLQNARVLQQVDKKFIPVIAGPTLAIIDQHAADERIRLEELRQKVLSGELKQITYLEAEKELLLPEIGYQLMHNYAEQIQQWGWICNASGHDSRSFTKNLNVLHRQPSFAKLVAVPCILGVNLTDVDLLEFLQQLADTDGSSTVPPSVHRVLNSKACRGAIMFGDTLLPSECSLIVEELKRTSLCFQCAHGRPTTIPLVNLAVLHEQIDMLESWSSTKRDLWHGLRRHEISLERASHRLSSAVG